jgi:hypothetical protein
MSPSSHDPLENKLLNKNPLFLIKTGKPLTVRKSHTWTKFTISLSRKFSYLVSMAPCCLVYKSQKIKKRERKEMKKKLLAGMLASATVLGMFVAGGTALAASVDSKDSEVGIGFTNHGPGVNPGPLQIKWAPIKLDFGTTNSTAGTTFNEQSGLKKYVVVDDTRGGGTDKWELSVGLSNLMSGATQLTGAQLKFDSVKQGYQGTDAPEAAGSIVAPTGSAAVTAANFTLAQGATAVKVMEDGTGGVGTHQGFSALEMANIQLDVPANAAEAGKQYAGKLTWSLDDTI